MPRTDEDRAKARAYYAANRDQINAYQRARGESKRDELTRRRRERYAENAAEHVGYQQAWRDANRDRVNELARAARYGLTVDELRQMYADCDSTCQGCGVAEADAPKERLYIDHDHACCPAAKSCGKCVRGLLCLHCNTTLGRCGDDPDVLIRLAQYLTDRVAKSVSA